MLEFLHRLARRLAPYQRLLWSVVLICISGFIAVVALSPDPRSDAFALLSMTALVWALLLITIVHSFTRPLPSLTTATGLWQRLKLRLRLALLWLLAVAMTAVGGLLVLFSARALGNLLG